MFDLIDDAYELLGPRMLNGIRENVPGYMVEGLLRYVIYGIKPGDFLSALLSNDFMEACRRGDDVNLQHLSRYAVVFYNYLPSGCFGSKANFDAWNGLKIVSET